MASGSLIQVPKVPFRYPGYLGTKKDQINDLRGTQSTPTPL